MPRNRTADATTPLSIADLRDGVQQLQEVFELSEPSIALLLKMPPSEFRRWLRDDNHRAGVREMLRGAIQVARGSLTVAGAALETVRVQQKINADQQARIDLLEGVADSPSQPTNGEQNDD